MPGLLHSELVRWQILISESNLRPKRRDRFGLQAKQRPGRRVQHIDPMDLYMTGRVWPLAIAKMLVRQSAEEFETKLS